MLDFLFAAVNEEFGVIIKTENPFRLQRRLREEIKDREQFKDLIVIVSPFNEKEEVWIFKNPGD